MVEYAVFDSCIRGYHVYKNIWTPSLGETLICELEFGNVHDPYAVAVKKASAGTIGHIPRNISALCHFFMRRNGIITCQVTGARRYSSDLVQGGLEVPCTYTFVGTGKDIAKAKKLLSLAPSTSLTEPPCKKIKVEVDDSDLLSLSPTDEVWLKFGGQCLTQLDRTSLIEGKMLNDRHINFAQLLMHSQFPHADGLTHTLLQDREKVEKIKQGLQIIFDRGNHWIVASNIGCDNGTVKVYDSLYTHVDEKSKAVIHNLFDLQCNTSDCIDIVGIKKQEGVKDCGLFAIAIATALLLGEDPATLHFKQSDMRNHLLKCYDTNKLSAFSVASYKI